MDRSKGFTLIEVMITVAIVGILAAIAYPSYLEQVRKSRRADAQSMLMNVGTRQQQMLLDTRSYATTAAALNVTVPSQIAAYYTLTVSAPAGTPPTFTATATPQGDQVHDRCGTLGVDNAGTKTALKGGAAPTGCW
jgi:type IV pilus assembly protein PilE